MKDMIVRGEAGVVGCDFGGTAMRLDERGEGRGVLDS